MGSHRVSNLLLVAVGIALLVELVEVMIDPSGSPSGLLTDALAVAILALPVLAFFLYVVGQPGRRIGWFLIGTGLALNSAGEGFFFFAHRTLSDFPTVGDFFCLALFPFLLGGVILLVRREREPTRISVGIDGLVIALAIGALAYELIFNALLGAGSISRLVGGELAYPILDLAALTMLAVICIPSHFRVGAAYFCLMAGMAVLLGTDVVNLRDTAAGTDAPSVALYFGWGLAIVVLSVSLEVQRVLDPL